MRHGFDSPCPARSCVSCYFRPQHRLRVSGPLAWRLVQRGVLRASRSRRLSTPCYSGASGLLASPLPPANGVVLRGMAPRPDARPKQRGFKWRTDGTDIACCYGTMRGPLGITLRLRGRQAPRYPRCLCLSYYWSYPFACERYERHRDNDRKLYYSSIYHEALKLSLTRVW